MKKQILPILAAAAAAHICGAQNAAKEPWNDYSVFKINKEEPAAMMKVFGSSAAAQKPISIGEIDRIHEGDRYELLNGDWKFFFANSRADVKDAFFKKDFDDSPWATVKVPCPWQCFGYDTVFYHNISHEFMFDKNGEWLPEFKEGASRFKRDDYAKIVYNPYIPEGHRQAGIYRRSFSVPQTWDGQSVFIRFDGVRTGFKVFVNGKFVGYSEDSFTPAEFNITKFIERGKKNSLAVEVYKFSTGAYCEMQDMPHVMGIIRDVYLMARPAVYIKDYYAPAELSEDLDSAQINFSVKLRNTSGKTQDNLQIRAFLVDENGKVFRKSLWQSALLDTEAGPIPANSYALVNKKIDVSGFKLWSPDKPNFYYLCITLAQDGKELETVRADYGFRKYKIVKRHMELNNVKMFIKGVNRHDWSPETGKTVSFEEMKKDVELMKDCNVNFVRTSHYPNDERFYMLCTRYGIAVLNENNHEQHAFIRNPALNLPNHIPPAVDRAENMVFNSRNVPSVLIMSVGNESALMYTLGHRAIEKVVRAHAPQHYFMSHGETYDIVNGQPNGTSDFVSPMYRDITQLERYLEMQTDKPFFTPEYAHAMGNSIGNLEGIWRFTRQHEGLNGGFIWDWIDQSLYLPRPEDKTKKFLSDGRDWGTKPSASNFCCNGIIFADRTISAKFYEVKRVYQHIFIDKAGDDPSKLKITNDFISTNTDEFDALVEVSRDGVSIAKKQLEPIDVAPGQTAEIAVELPKFDSSQAGEYFYKISFNYKQDKLWAPKGSPAATAQFLLKKVEAPEYSAKGAIEVDYGSGEVAVKAGGAEAVFDAKSAKLKSYKAGGKDIVVKPVEFDFKTAYIDNHRNALRHDVQRNRMDKLCESASRLTVQNLAAGGGEGAVRVFCEKIYDNSRGQGFKTLFVYTIIPDGSMQVSARAAKINNTPRYMLLPRVGLRMGINKKLDSVEYLGKGPFANYVDRACAADVGKYKSSVADWFEPFTFVQDTGNREQVRWLALTDGESGVLISAPKPLPMALLPHTQDELSAAKHPYQLPESSASDLRVSAITAGLGNNSCGLPPRDEFRTDFKGSLEWKFVVKPLASPEKAAELGRARFPSKFDFTPAHLADNLKVENMKKIKAAASVDKSNAGAGSDY